MKRSCMCVLALAVFALLASAQGIDETVMQQAFIYDDIYDFSEELCAVKKDGKVGFIDTEGREVIPCIYEMGGLSEFMNARKANYEFSEGLVAARLGGKWGFIDREGNMVVPAIYDYALPFYDGYARVVRNTKWGIINRQGEEVIPCQYGSRGSGVSEFYEGLAVVNEFKTGGGKIGFADTAGQIVIPCIYDRLFSISQNAFLIQRWNVETTFSVDLDYFTFKDGLAAVRLDKKMGYIDKTGKEVIPCKYFMVGFSDFSEGLTEVAYSDKKMGKLLLGYVDREGNEVIPPQYEDSRPFSNGLARVMLKKKWGVINKQGEVVVPFIYDVISEFSEHLAAVIKDNKIGFVNEKGEEVIPPQYNKINEEDIKIIDYTREISCAIKDDPKSKQAYTPIAKPEWYNLYRFVDGTAWVYLSRDKEFLLIDKSGQRVSNETVIANEIHDGLLLCLHNKKYKFLVGESYLSGETVEAFPAAYDDAKPFHNGLAEVRQGDKWGVIDTLGNVVVPVVYKIPSPNRSLGGGIFNFDKTLSDITYGALDTHVHISTYNRVGFGFSRVEYNKKKGFLDKDGKPLIIKQK
ncbi:MAG: WG repeat-containing protein [Dysgonamonadaceae bacterium]|nr:WG repeat-containing protein [Dysgonamonadaceae bacterium]